MAVNPLAIGGGVVATAAVVGGGLYAGGVFSGEDKGKGGIGDRKPGLAPETPWKPLSEDTAFTASSSEYENKYGKTYARFFVGVGTPHDNGNNKINKGWWDKRMETFVKPATGKFKNVTKATDGADSLRGVCDSAYKSQTDKVTESGNDTDEFKESEVWSFCSPAKEKIKTVKDNGEKSSLGQTGSYAQTGTNEEKLVSATGNDWFWNEREKDLANHKFTDSDTNSEFKKLKEKTQKDPKVDTVRKTCENAYKADATGTGGTNNTYTKEEVGKFCSLSGAALS